MLLTLKKKKEKRKKEKRERERGEKALRKMKKIFDTLHAELFQK
jgi:hypothetical protein